ncbi:hypothetical protein HALA3H3_30114 [Halomonas sp. A3H3]|nr:conserved hypothetical protein [Halomonas sp. 156]CAD5280907.1 conserved hypothetical protein [Halomonas sp. 113]CAD5282393.1 conserved hypothetical protein [Halomonas sp. 59]CAD5288501.1 conserved hypothetical protein [Halomonas sp. I3]CDG51897.1 hypothetical protein HALA3H3_30114 [Halomonas sp. A3H3]VXB14214.1 conserved hypothetical protein [Halomonas titanicae]
MYNLQLALRLIDKMSHTSIVGKPFRRRGMRSNDFTSQPEFERRPAWLTGKRH